MGRERLGWCEGGVVVGTTEDRGGGVIRGEAIKLQWLIIHGGRDKKDDTEGTLRDEQKQTIRCRCRVELPTAWVSLETVKGYNSSTNVCQLTTDARGEMGQQTELNNRHKKKKEKKKWNNSQKGQNSRKQSKENTQLQMTDTKNRTLITKATLGPQLETTDKGLNSRRQIQKGQHSRHTRDIPPNDRHTRDI